MEVHAHTHTPRKKWTHYFWEFLMLFFAVFCGFMAENQREHYVEHQREKKYAIQLISDLRADSAFFVWMARGLDSNIVWHKEFEKIMSSSSATDHDIVKGYIKLQAFFSMNATTATYSEMKSSGSFRYMQNTELTRVLKKYYEGSLSFLKIAEEGAYDFFTNHIDPFTLKHFRMTDIDLINTKLLTDSPVFLQRNKDSEIGLMNIMGMYKANLVLYLERGVMPAKKRVNEIIELLKKEYHLK